MLEKIKNHRSRQATRQNPANLWLVTLLALSLSLGCSYFGGKTEESAVAETKRMTLAEAKNSRDLVSVMKTHDRVKAAVLTKVSVEEPPSKADGEIARATTQYKKNWERTDLVNMVVIKFSSAEKASAYLDYEESNQKAKGGTPARNKNADGEATLFFGDGKGAVTFLTCKKDVCYSFPTNSVKAVVAGADFFSDYEKEYLGAKS